jgi:hypothetical protein
MTDREFLRRWRTMRLMKQLGDLRRDRPVREAKDERSARRQSPELDKSLQLLKELAAKLDGPK